MSDTRGKLLGKLKEKKNPELKQKIEVEVPKIQERVLVSKVIDKTGSTMMYSLP